jgi:hypothetical protein
MSSSVEATESSVSSSPPPSDFGDQNSSPSGYDADDSRPYNSGRFNQDLRQSELFSIGSNQVGDDQYREAEQGLDGTLS